MLAARQLQAAAELELRRRRDPGPKGERLYDFIPRISRGRYGAPRHLDPLVRQLERSWHEPVRCTAHAPPRHAKTDTVLHFCAQTLVKFPRKRIAYVTYGADIAAEKSVACRAIAHEAGVKLEPGQNRADKWNTTDGGVFRAVGVGGSLTSAGVDLLVVDDPYKDRPQAESGAWRKRVKDWWSSVGNTRIEPGGSAFLFHTRWVRDDLIGFVHETDGVANDNDPAVDWTTWRNVVMPAVNDNGEALWPERWPLELLRPKMRHAYDWASLYQGSPVPRGGSVFKAPYYYDWPLPAVGKITVGVDLAYSEDTRSNWSVAVVMLTTPDGASYVLEVVRRQCEVDAFAADLAAVKRAYPSAKFFWYGPAQEKSLARLIRRLVGVRIVVWPARASKYTRAQDTAVDWNDGLVLLPSGRDTECAGCTDGECDEHGQPEWAEPLADEVCEFTGLDDPEDDQVDALVAARDGARKRVGSSDDSDGRFGAACAA